jgi:hypothetical protein
VASGCAAESALLRLLRSSWLPGSERQHDGGDDVSSSRLLSDNARLRKELPLCGSFTIRWIMLVSGVLTIPMVRAAITPDAALESTFGETVSGPLAHLVVRNWGALIALIGGMLIYAAFNPPQRPLLLIVAGASKTVFIALVLSEGARYLTHQGGVAIAVDSLMVVVFWWYSVAARSVAVRAASATRLAV